MLRLQNIMRANATSCILFGLLFSILPKQVATFLSQQQSVPQLIILIIGLGLIVNGLHLLWTATKEKPNKYWVIYFSVGDFIWVFATISLILSDYWINTTFGITTTLVISAFVGWFGVMQLKNIN